MQTAKTLPASVTVLLLSLAVSIWPSPAAAQTVPFKIMLTELWQLDLDVDPFLGLIGDYYAKVTINGVEQDNEGACEDGTTAGLIVAFRLFKNFDAIPQCKARTPWVFTRQVPAGQPVRVRIQIFDSDEIFDDEADAKPGDGTAIELEIDPLTGLWSGDFAWPQNCSRPTLLPLEDDNVNVCWQVSFDSDDDGLLDVWERFGVDTDNDSVTDVDLPGLGANALRKDLFVELDHLVAVDHEHAPRRDAIDAIVKSFANAPVQNVDGTTGVQLHVDVGLLFGPLVTVAGSGGAIGTYGNLGGGNAIGEPGNEIIDAFGRGKGSGAKVSDLKALHFDSARESVFRYAIFGHQTNARAAVNDCTSGVSSPTRRDFFVTLGGVGSDGALCWAADLNGFSVGSFSEQAGTFMHELGHTLGLEHGGGDRTNDKPNYLSVMNYSRQLCEVPTVLGKLPGGCDYSRTVLGVLPLTLDETDLDECQGIGGGLDFGPIDWNNNKLFDGESRCGPIFTNITADINDDGVCVTGGPNQRLDTRPLGDDNEKPEPTITDGLDRVCDTKAAAGSDDRQDTAADETPVQPDVLKSFDDWGHLQFSITSFTSALGDAPADQEADPQTIRESRRLLSVMTTPAIALEHSGPTVARPGDVVSYRVNVTNTGRGPALSAVLEEQNPDGAVVTVDLDVLPVGSDLTRVSNFTVPANTCPGDLTNAGASLSFKDFAGEQFTVADTTPLQILDVEPPAFALIVSPDVLWPPNHELVPVTATIASRDNCDPAPTVTLVSITSNEPAAGFLGQGDRAPDIEGAAFGTDDRAFSLRSERGTGQGSTGRVYTITYRVVDASGNATEQSAIVRVPPSNNGQ